MKALAAKNRSGLERFVGSESPDCPPLRGDQGGCSSKNAPASLASAAALLVFAIVLAGCYPESKPDEGYVPSSYALAKNRTAVELVRTGRLEEALVPLEEAIKNDPHFVQPYSVKATILVKLGRFEEAAKTLAHAVEVDDSLAQAHVLRGICQEKAGKTTEARASYIRGVAAFDEVMKDGENDPKRAVSRVIAVYLGQGRLDAFKEIDQVLSKYPAYQKAAFVQSRIDKDDRDYFLSWTSDDSDAEGAQSSSGAS